jgi:hypothetical protein
MTDAARSTSRIFLSVWQRPSLKQQEGAPSVAFSSFDAWARAETSGDYCISEPCFDGTKGEGGDMKLFPPTREKAVFFPTSRVTFVLASY